MYGDFSHEPSLIDPRITRIMFQQGRPLVEADLNLGLAWSQRRAPRELPQIGECKAVDGSEDIFITSFGHPVKANDYILVTFCQAHLAKCYKVVSVDDGVIKIKDVKQKDKQGKKSGRVEIEKLIFPQAGQPFSITIRDDKLHLVPGSFSVRHFNVEHDGLSLKSDQTGFTPIVWGKPEERKDGKHLVVLAAKERPLFPVERTSMGIPERSSLVAYKSVWQVILKNIESVDQHDCAELLGELNSSAPPATVSLSGRPSGRLIRIELHDVRKQNNKVEVDLKIDLKNASRCFSLADPRPISANPLERIPEREGEWYDIEELDSLSWVDEKITPKQPQQTGKNSGFYYSKPKEKWDQVNLRCWTDFRSIEVDDPKIIPITIDVDGVSINFKIDLTSSEIRRGDYWIIRCDTNEQRTISGIRPVAYLPLGKVELKDGKFSNASPLNASVHSSYAAIAVSSQLQYSQPPLNKNVHDLLLQQPLTVSAKSVNLRRWLASMTVCELLDISRDELRQRILRDCNLDKKDLESFESDLDQIVAGRSAFDNLNIKPA